MSKRVRVADVIRDAEKTDLCGRCTAVCCRLTVVLTADDRVPARFIAVQTQGPDQLLKLADGWCAALDRSSMRCSIYEQRPQTCRKFAMGGAYCMDERQRWAGRLLLGNLPVPVLTPFNEPLDSAQTLVPAA
ncbi:MAG: YkgJ family cysteine cluster protein [Pseudomarimonas sp.]